MTRTLRFYNRGPRGTWRRFNDAMGLFHPFYQRCMGRCRWCRDPSQEQRHLRKVRNREVRAEILAGILDLEQGVPIRQGSRRLGRCLV